MAADEVQQRHRVVVADVEHPVGRAAGRRVGAHRVVAGIGLGSAVVDADHAFDDVVDVGEVALHVAVVEDVDRPPFEDRLGEQEQRHVRPAPRAIHREEAQPGGRQAEQMAVGVRHQLVGLLGGRVQADRVVDAVMLGERHLGVAAVDAGARGIDQVLHAVVAAAFEDVGEADQVAVDVGVRVLQRVAHAGLGGEVDHAVELLGGEQSSMPRDRPRQLDEAETRGAGAAAPAALP
jgi:hypothetical protein